MLSIPTILFCIAFSASLTILGVYAVGFVKFVRDDNKYRYEQELNMKVEDILKRHDYRPSPKVIDITDFLDHPTPYTERDALLDDLSTRSLVYMHDMGMWIKTEKR